MRKLLAIAVGLLLLAACTPAASDPSVPPDLPSADVVATAVAAPPLEIFGV